jgi:pimeloyl-ACP methyl ester carboxylesterase
MISTTATYVLIHGAGDVGWYWHLVEAELRGYGHDVVVMDLPVEDDSAGLSAYADVVVEAIGDRDNLVVVAQSFGGYIAPIVCDRILARLLVLVAAMIPAPGESAEAMFANTGYAPAEQDDPSDLAIFYHDVDPTLAAEALAKGTTAYSLRRGCVASCEIALASSPTRSTAATRPRSATQASWSGGSRPIGPITP